MSLRVAETANTSIGGGNGYVTYDFFATVNTYMGGFELRVSTDTSDGIYQNSLTADDPEDSDALDSYVSIGYPSAGEQSTNTNVLGGAVDIGGGTALAFDSQDISVAWAPEYAVGDVGHGEFHIAQVTLKWGTVASFDLAGWQTEDQPVSQAEYGVWDADLSATGYMSLIPGDVNGDGLVDGADLSTIIGYWGQTGLGRKFGDLNGDGTVEGNDYSEVLSYWNPASPEPTPEPATLGLLIMGGLALLRRKPS